MKYLGKIGKLGVFFSAFVLVFLFSDKTVLAVKTGDSCTVSGYTGTCRVYSEGCNSGEKKVGVGTCESGGTAYVCCVTTNDDISSTDDECKKANGLCEASLPCSDNRQEKGYCTTSIIGVIKSCCTDPKTSSTSTGSGTSSSSGTASLKYTPLENLPGFEDQGGDFATYFGNLYKLALWIVGISALFMLVVGGFLYLSSAGNTALLGTAKKTIYSALIGLVIALVSWLLLDTINSDLTNLKLSGLSGAISSGSSSGTGSSASAGTGSGGSTATGTYTHAEAAAALSAAGIGITSSSGRIGCSDVGCTTLEGIPKSAIDNLISIKKDCGCSFNVTGGTEAGHASHGSGKPIVDVTQDTTLGNFLYSKAGGSGGATITKSPGYGISKICVTTAWEKLNFGCGSYREDAAHFHLVF